MQTEPEKAAKLDSYLAKLSRPLSFFGDAVERRLILEYGAVFAARGGAIPPPVIVFKDAAAVDEFQAGLEKETVIVGGIEITLQAPAMRALLSAVNTAAGMGLAITPRGLEAAARSYEQTVSLWASRVEPALDHWTKTGALDSEKAEAVRGLSPFEQVGQVLRLEADGLWFSKDLSKSILQSVAPPGASQHLSLLALDVAEFDDASVRRILASHHWYQTVVSDLPHFTYLGVEESELPNLGLIRVESGDRDFWIPDI